MKSSDNILKKVWLVDDNLAYPFSMIDLMSSSLKLNNDYGDDFDNNDDEIISDLGISTARPITLNITSPLIRIQCSDGKDLLRISYRSSETMIVPGVCDSDYENDYVDEGDGDSLVDLPMEINQFIRTTKSNYYLLKPRSDNCQCYCQSCVQKMSCVHESTKIATYRPLNLIPILKTENDNNTILVYNRDNTCHRVIEVLPTIHVVRTERDVPANVQSDFCIKCPSSSIGYFERNRFQKSNKSLTYSGGEAFATRKNEPDQTLVLQAETGHAIPGTTEEYSPEHSSTLNRESGHASQRVTRQCSVHLAPVPDIEVLNTSISREPSSQRRKGKCSSLESLNNNEKLPYEKPFRASSSGWSMSFALMMLMMLLPQTLALPAVIRIGAIFTEDQRDSATELAFKYAVYRINNDKIVLPNTTLVFDIQYAPRDDSFHTAKKACKQITFGVQAIFGPFEPLLGSHIQSITDALDIPHLEARLDMEPQEKEFSINLYPSHLYLNQAYKDMIQFLKWKKVAIVYEEDFGLMKLQEIIRSPPSKSIEIYIRQGHPENYRDILKEVKHKEIYSIIVDTLPENMNLFLRCLLQLQMNDYRYHYLFTTFDIETFDLEDFKYNFVNMTAFRLVDTDNIHVRRTLLDMERFQPIGHSILNKSAIIQAEPALIYDSVNVFAKGLHALERSATLSLANLSCESETPWPDGSSLFNYINAVEYNGVTGPIKFTEGKRSNFKLDILKLRMEKLYKVGEWTPETQINITDHQAFFEGGKPNITLKVITIEEKPYVMVRGKNFTGNDRYYGFCIDLLERLAGMTGFDYEIEAMENARYGTYNITTGEWDGLVRMTSDKKADLAVGSMTINYARESVIDFTKPFMNLGVSILFKIPTSQPTRLFSFMNPLAVEIWLYVLAAYMLVSFTMFVMARFSPYEWNNPHPCNDESDIVENQFTLSNSFWFITGTLLRQGSGLNPKAASTRIVGGIWWFFTLIIISSYTANLAAFLTVERMITPIESAEDLAEQNEIEYGTLEGGSTMAFFRDSKIETYQKMWRYMESKRPSVFVPTIEEGVQRVLKGNYAFLMESTMLDYTIQRNCNLTQIGGLLNSNSYGIATPIGSPWRDKISLAILELQEKGIIQMLYSKWWKNTGDVCNRDEKNKDSKANALGVENIGGVFVVLLCGLALAIVVAILEFCWNSRKNAQTDRYYDDDEDDEEDENDDDVEYDENGDRIKKPKIPRVQQSLCSEMAEELRFAMRCQGSRQRPALRRNCSRCTPGTTYVPAVNDLPQANGENGLLPMIEFRKSSVVQFDSTSPS